MQELQGIEVFVMLSTQSADFPIEKVSIRSTFFLSHFRLSFPRRRLLPTSSPPLRRTVVINSR